MIDLYDHFFEKLLFNEVGVASINLATPLTKIPKPQAKPETDMDIPASLTALYSQVQYIQVLWEISRKRNSDELDQLKQDVWLRENYLDKGYDWGVLVEFMSGSVNIQKLEDLFNKDFCRNQAYYFTIKNHISGENADDYFPFDIHWSLTACLKKEEGKISDNVWLVHTDGEKMYDMKINIATYMELCYKAKGFHYWQLVYILNEKSGEWYEFMKRFLPRLLTHVKLELSAFGIQ